MSTDYTLEIWPNPDGTFGGFFKTISAERSTQWLAGKMLTQVEEFRPAKETLHKELCENCELHFLRIPRSSSFLHFIDTISAMVGLIVNKINKKVFVISGCLCRSGKDEEQARANAHELAIKITDRICDDPQSKAKSDH